MFRYYRLLNVFKVFFCKIRETHVFNHSGVKDTDSSAVISKLAVTTRIVINCSSTNFFLR